MKALTRKEKQARTRAKLMRSAARLFCRQGLEQASVEDIAQDAGFTKGAFYSNFKSKEELFLAMLDEKFGEQIERIESALQSDEAPDEAARHAGEAFVRSIRADREWERLYFEFVAHASRNEEFRQEFLTRCRAMNERLEEVYRRWHDRGVGNSRKFDQQDAVGKAWMYARRELQGKARLAAPASAGQSEQSSDTAKQCVLGRPKVLLAPDQANTLRGQVVVQLGRDAWHATTPRAPR